MAQYIDKDALVAEINRVLNSYDPNEITSGRYALVDLRNFIDTLEVKEVDLKKEVNECLFPLDIYGEERPETAEIIEIVAKHFFELGINAQKDE